MAVTSSADGSVTVDGVYVGNFITNPSIKLMSEAALLEYAGLSSSAAILPEDDWGQYDPLGVGPEPITGGPGSQDSGAGFAHDPWVPHDPDPDWHPEPHGTPGSPEYGQPGFYDIDDWYSQAAEARPDYYNEAFEPGQLFSPALDFVDSVRFDTLLPDRTEVEVANQGGSMPDYSGGTIADPSACKLALMNKAIIAIVQAGAVTSTGNPLLGVVGSILINGLKRLGVGPDWGRRIFGDSPDSEICQRIVEEAIAVGYLRIPKPNADGSLPANMQITLNPDSPRATLQWGRKRAATRRATTRAPARRRTYRRKS